MTALIKKTWFRAAVIALIAVMASCSVISAAFTVFLGHNGIYEGSRKDFSERILKDNALDRAYDFLNENVHYGEESDGDDNVSLSRNALNDEDYDFIVKYDGNTIAKSYEKNEKYVVSSLEAYGEYNGKELSVKAFLKDGHEAAASMKWINRAYDFRYAVPALSISLVILVIAGIVILIKGTDLWFRKIPADLYSLALDNNFHTQSFEGICIRCSFKQNLTFLYRYILHSSFSHMDDSCNRAGKRRRPD